MSINITAPTERMKDAFWLVWNENGHAPTFVHTSEGSAQKEASRLARLNPGQEFHVLESIGTALKRDVDWVPHGRHPPF